MLAVGPMIGSGDGTPPGNIWIVLRAVDIFRSSVITCLSKITVSSPFKTGWVAFLFPNLISFPSI